MATARLEKVNEFLTCTVCTEEYSDPCTLKCQHTFCRKCITQYTKTRPEAVRSKTIPCPCCRQVMKVPDPTRPVDEWAWQVKPSIIILGLIDTSEPEGTTKGSSRCCGVCEHIGETTPAKFWCPDCEVALCDRCKKGHRGHPASRDHETCDLSEEFKVKRQRKVICTEHKKNHIEFHCNDCKKPACQKCCILHHRSCKSLVTIESMTSEMKTVLEGKRQILTKQLKVRTNKVTKKKASVSKASYNKTKIHSNIRSASQAAIDKIKQKEKQLMDKLGDFIEKQTTQLQADVKTEEIEIQMYRQHYEFIDLTLKTESVMDMYDMYQACLSEAVVLEEGEDRDRAETQEIKDICFIQDTDKLKHSLEDLQLGEINVTYQEASESMSSPVLSNTIDMKTENMNITDMIVLVVDGVHIPVVTDDRNRCVKSFFSRNNKPGYSRFDPDGGPYGITQLSVRQAMVAVPLSKKIIKIEVRPELRLISTIKTDKKYFGLTILNHTSMAATLYFPDNCVHILNMAGHVIKSIPNPNLFNAPNRICISNKGHLLVTDFGKKSIVCLTSEGNLVWTYTDENLTGLSGITTTSTASVLVSDCSSDKVIQLSDDGKFIRDVLSSQNDIKSPRAIYCSEQGYMFVCERKYLKMFQLT